MISNISLAVILGLGLWLNRWSIVGGDLTRTCKDASARVIKSGFCSLNVASLEVHALRFSAVLRAFMMIPDTMSEVDRFVKEDKRLSSRRW